MQLFYEKRCGSSMTRAAILLTEELSFSFSTIVSTFWPPKRCVSSMSRDATLVSYENSLDFFYEKSFDYTVKRATTLLREELCEIVSIFGTSKERLSSLWFSMKRPYALLWEELWESLVSSVKKASTRLWKELIFFFSEKGFDSAVRRA